MTRWLATNRASLTAEQVEAAQAAIEAVTPELYRFDEPDLQRATGITEVVRRLESVLSAEQFRQFAVVR